MRENFATAEIDTNSFYAVIPWRILTHKLLPPMAKLIYGEISSLSNQDGRSTASNAHYASLFNISTHSVTRFTGILRRQGFIDIQIEPVTNKRTIILKGVWTDLSRRMDKSVHEDIISFIPNNIIRRDNRDNIYIRREELLTVERIFKVYCDKIHRKARLTKTGINKIKTRLKSFSLEELLDAIEKFSKNKWRMDNNSNNGVAWFFRSDEQIAIFLALKSIRMPRHFDATKKDESVEDFMKKNA